MGSNLIVGQSGGPTAVINSSLAGVIAAAQAAPGIDRVYGMRRGVEGLLHDDLVDLTDLDDMTLRRLAHTPGAALGSCRRKLDDDALDAIITRLAARDVGVFCYIGGNDSADTTHRVASAARASHHDLCAIAVPKTIDNDLPETDHCPGYGSIARYVAIAAAESTLDTRSLPTNYPVKLIEVMGRDAGWVVAASALAKQHADDGPHLLYPPERPLRPERFLDDVRSIHKEIGYVVVVVAETVRDEQGLPVAADAAGFDSFGHPLLRGAAETLARLVEHELGLPARFDKPGTLQRSSALALSPVDVAEAREAGRAAVRLARDGQSDLMVTLERTGDEPYRCETGEAPLTRIANRQRLLPAEFLAPESFAITEAFRRYALPLLGPDPFPSFARL